MKGIKKFSAVFFSLLFVLTVLLANFLSVFTNAKNENRFRDFYLIPKNTLDVVFLGSSGIHTCVYPTVAYQNEGFTGYCLSSDKCPYLAILPMAKEIMKYQSPKLLVIDMDAFTFPQDYMEDEWPMIYWLNSYPFGREKLSLIHRYIPKDKALPYYFPLIRNHSMFTDLSQSKELFSLAARYYFKKDDSVVLKGAELGNRIEPNIAYMLDMNQDTRAADICPNSEKALRELLDYCKTLDVKVVFYDFPRARLKDDPDNVYQKSLMINSVQKIVRQAGFDAVNYNTLHNPAGLTVNDFLIDNTHLNVDGSEKFTKYLSSYLKETYRFEIRHDPSCDAQWKADAESVEKMIDELRTNRESNRLINENDLH